MLLLVAPALFAASIYMELARIVELVDGDEHLFISRRWLTTIFVFGDVVSFLMQGSGMCQITPSKLSRPHIRHPNFHLPLRRSLPAELKHALTQ